MTEDFIRLNIDELEALQNALQLLSKKEQKIMESSGKVQLKTLHDKLVNSIEFMKKH